jgi:Flp pilus assembly protein TadD
MDPTFAIARAGLGLAYEQKGMLMEAVAEFERAGALSGGMPSIMAALGHAYALSGKRREAQQAIQTLRDLSRRRYVSSYNIAVVAAGLGQRDDALEWLQKAYQERSGALVYLDLDPRLYGLHSDERFLDIVRPMGLRQQLATAR